MKKILTLLIVAGALSACEATQTTDQVVAEDANATSPVEDTTGQDRVQDQDRTGSN